MIWGGLSTLAALALAHGLHFTGALNKALRNCGD